MAELKRLEAEFGPKTDESTAAISKQKHSESLAYLH